MIENLLHLVTRYSSKKNDGLVENLDAAHVFQFDTASAYEDTLYNPFICIVLQGQKELIVGSQTTTLVQGDALLVSHDLPVRARILQASPQMPYCALVFALDLEVLHSLYEQVGHRVSGTETSSALTATVADPAYLAPMERYLSLMDAPLDAQVLGPMILREIHFRLLMSPIGVMLTDLLAVNSNASRIAKAITHISLNFSEPLNVADLADIAGMSQSSFHAHFKTVTGTTPLQYQKDLRMLSAREILMRGGSSVSVAGFEVGYQSSAHFSRDYSRKFGVPPKDHLARII